MKRRVKFKAGRMAYENIMALIQQQAVSQLNGMGGFLGGDRVLPALQYQDH